MEGLLSTGPIPSSFVPIDCQVLSNSWALLLLSLLLQLLPIPSLPLNVDLQHDVLLAHEGEGDAALGGVALLATFAHVKHSLHQVEGDTHEVVSDLVFIGEDEIVEA